MDSLEGIMMYSLQCVGSSNGCTRMNLKVTVIKPFPRS